MKEFPSARDTDSPTSDNPPVFGRRVDGCPYIVRPSAYALIRNVDGALAVVRTAGGCFLPGGGMEPGEHPEMTIERETAEECGLLVTASAMVGSAVEIVHSPGENACFEKRSVFLEATVRGSTRAVETDHDLLWLLPERAVETLSHESHRWGVQRFIERSR